MKLVKFLFVSFVVLVSFTSCYDEYTNDYETPNMGFAVANPLRTVIADRGMPIYIGVSIGGKREVDMSDWAKFEIDPSLVEGTAKYCFQVITIHYLTRNIFVYVSLIFRLLMSV